MVCRQTRYVYVPFTTGSAADLWLLLIFLIFMKISSVFKDGQTIPERFTCKGENVNPRLDFSELPIEAKSLALIMDDPDAPAGTFVHWVAWNIPVSKEIKENANGLGVDGVGSFGVPGYRGPCPPPGNGPHRYFFKAYALDCLLELKPGSDKEKLLKAMEGHVLASAELMGRFER